jgi:hypothetical protein
LFLAAALLSLLVPVQRAAEKSALVAELLATGELPGIAVPFTAERFARR